MQHTIYPFRIWLYACNNISPRVTWVEYVYPRISASSAYGGVIAVANAHNTVQCI
jgi:hypothetical protein